MGGNIGNCPLNCAGLRILLDHRYWGTGKATDRACSLLRICLFKCLKKFKALFLIFNERITLAVRAKIDRASQILHRLKMFHPEIVDPLQKHTLYRRVERIAHFFFLLINYFFELFIAECDLRKFCVDRDTPAGEQCIAARVYRLALYVEHVVVCEHVFARIEVELLDARLRLLE